MGVEAYVLLQVEGRRKRLQVSLHLFNMTGLLSKLSLTDYFPDEREHTFLQTRSTAVLSVHNAQQINNCSAFSSQQTPANKRRHASQEDS